MESKRDVLHFAHASVAITLSQQVKIQKAIVETELRLVNDYYIVENMSALPASQNIA